MNKKAIFNWSGGKDSAFALGEILKDPSFDIKYLLTTIGSKNRRISMHGVREELLFQQVQSIGIPIQLLELSESQDIQEYETTLSSWMEKAKSQGIEYSIFGDIFLEDLRKYREAQLEKVGFKAVFPLWKRDTLRLIQDFIDQGFQAVLTAVDKSKLSEDFVGQIIDHYFLKQLPGNVDPCGENGEFHSFVYNAPYFKKPVLFSRGEIVLKKYEIKDPNISSEFWFCDLLPIEI